MRPNNYELRAIVAARDGEIEAQLLEIDIAARGKDVASLLRALGHAITVSYEISLDLGEAPFSSLMPTPFTFHRQWSDDGAKPMGYIEVSKEVGMALATALHLRQPISSIAVLEKIAA